MTHSSATHGLKLMSDLAAASGDRGEILRTPRIAEAIALAEEIYADRKHWTRMSLFEHVTGVLRMFLTFEPDEDAVIACLLHHALETKALTLNDLEERFGADVRSIVSAVHLLSHVTTRNRRMSIENLRLMFLRVSDDVRVVLMILCDQGELLEHLTALSTSDRRRVCQDVLDLFAPVAARLGIYALKHQLEQKAFPVVYPTDAVRITEQMEALRAEHGLFLESAAMQLAAFFAAEGVQARVEGREKEPYSLFRKMMQKSVTHVRDVYDLFALRVIVESDASCYQVLGLLHRIGHPVHNRFKDYIAFPKPNGYQSLHTTVARLPGIPESVFVEVQIRTVTMHREAEYGVAAHWNYKEGGDIAQAARHMAIARILSLQQPLEGGSRPVPLSDHIFVLTPKGDVLELPEGATPLDFAFSVHTDLGVAYRAARVNGSIVPLTYQLENGDVVEILRHHDPKPSPQWLLMLRTAPARSRLKRYLASRDRPRFIALGREAINGELIKRKLPPLDPDLTLLKIFDARTLTLAEREDLLIKVGQGSLKASALLPDLRSRTVRPTSLRRAAQKAAAAIGGQGAPFRVEGDIPMPVRAARCCQPQSGKRGPLCGVISRAGDIRVHRSACKMMRNVNPERRIRVKWKTEN